MGEVGFWRLLCSQSLALSWSGNTISTLYGGALTPVGVVDTVSSIVVTMNGILLENGSIFGCR